MIFYLGLLILCFELSCTAMDFPLADAQIPAQSDTKLVWPLEGPAKFSPDGKKLLVSQQKTDYWSIYKNGPLHILDIQTGQKTILENSVSSEPHANHAESNGYFKTSLSPLASLVKAHYFTHVKQVTQGPDTYFEKPILVELPMAVLKVWNVQGKLLYQRHAPWGVKLYFTADDQYLLAKERENPLRVYDAQTCKLLAELGEPCGPERRLPVDPQNKWLLQFDHAKYQTNLFDMKTLQLIKKFVKSVPGIAQKFSHDGNLLMVSHEQDGTIESPETTYCTEAGYITYFCTVYNRRLEKVAQFTMPACYQFDISLDNKVAVCIDIETENHYPLPVGKSEHFKHRPQDYSFSFTFSTRDCKKKIILTPQDDAHTFVTVSESENSKETFVVNTNEFLNKLYYTRLPHLVCLANYGRIKYLLNTLTKTVTPCDIYMNKGIYRRQPIAQVSQDNLLVTNTKDHGYQLRVINQ